MTSAGDLLGLQDLDLRHDSRRSLIADIELRLVESAELIAAREAKEALENLLSQLQSRQRGIDTQLQDLDARLGPIETKLYDGSIRNPKELTDLQREIALLKAKRGQLDDDGLETLEEIEEASEAAAVAEERLSEVQRRWQEDQKRLQEEKSSAEEESRRLEEDRAARIRGMDASALGMYEALRSSKQGRAVARVERGSCQGCRIGLPTNLVQRIRAQETLVQCPSCERILVAT